MKSEKYLMAAKNLCLAADIAIKAIKKHPKKNWEDNHSINFYLYTKNLIENSEPKFQNMTSLKYDYEAIFTYFQEAAGDDVDYFWQQIKEHELPYKRENKLVKILKRKKINNDIEYDFAIDVIVPYEQEGLISEEESVLLGQYIGDYESKKKN